MYLIAGTLLAEPLFRARPADPGKFDYYVLSLSWSPQFCAGAQGKQGNNDVQCAPGKQFGFVTHGLWPQFLPKDWPESCSTAAGPNRQLVDHMLDIMPAPGLIRHEWQKHGTCDGGPPAQYFARIRKAYESVRIPADYKQPPRRIMVKPADLKRKFLQANPGAPEDSISVVCGGNGGRFLSEVRVCLTRDLKARACGQDVRDSCRVPEIILPPVR
jgi:ribonuclease T2